MREIKFRAFDKKNKEMCEVMTITFDINRNITTVGVRTSNGKHHNINCKDVKLMQFTGLKDKNNKEIYERDILKVQSHYFGDTKVDEYKDGVVKFNEASFDIYRGDIDTSCWEYWDSLSDVALNNLVEVIGNVYKNPELLKEK